MHEYNSQQAYFPNNILDSVNILLLEKFKKYNSQGKNLFCSYMSVGQKYKNELLVIGREPSHWPAVFSIEELNEMGAEYIFNTKVRYHAINTSYNSMLDPFWGCTKEILIKFGICKNEIVSVHLENLIMAFIKPKPWSLFTPRNISVKN